MAETGTETVPVDTRQLPWRVRRAVRDLERRAPLRGKSARVRWWHRLRGLTGLAVSAVVIGVLMAALVLSALALVLYLLNQFAK